MKATEEIPTLTVPKGIIFLSISLNLSNPSSESARAIHLSGKNMSGLGKILPFLCIDQAWVPTIVPGGRKYRMSSKPFRSSEAV
jgi:hypothetical protein